MILRRLCEFTERISDLPPSMYGLLPVRWQIELDGEGRYRGITRLSDGSKQDRGLQLMVPNLKRAGTKAPAVLLADNAKYVLGLGAESPAQSRHFTEFKELVDACAAHTGEPAVCAVSRFLAAYAASPIAFGVEIEASDNIIFRVDDVRPTDLRSVRAFWASHNAAAEGEQMQCLVCGSVGPVDRVSPIPIKGIPGGQSTGMAVVSANKSAFESYGAEQAYIAPTCRSCGEAYANAINHLIRSDEHCVKIGPSVFLFWTVDDNTLSVASLISSPQPEAVRDLIISYRNGRQQYGVEASAFYALSLSASVGRVVVRDWLDTTVPAVEANLSRWFGLQRIVETDGSDGRPLGVYPLAACLYLNANDQMVAEVPRTLVRCALSGGKLPVSLIAQAVARNRAEQRVTRPRAALIKAVLLSEMNSEKEGYMENLEKSCKNPAYLCGRLLAVLEIAQKIATSPKATLVDRYYGAASSAPASVFGNLLRDFQVAHLGKLRKEKPGIYYALDNQAQDILENLIEFPSTLDMQGQAMFSLGYYHQKAANRAEARAKAELKALAAQEGEE